MTLPFANEVTRWASEGGLVAEGDWLVSVISHELRETVDGKPYALTKLKILEEPYVNRYMAIAIGRSAVGKLPYGITPQRWINLYGFDAIARVKHKHYPKEGKIVMYVERVL